MVVFEDADLERAADAAVFMIYSLNGERCTSSSRLLVQRSIHDRSVEMGIEKAKGIKVGHPLDPATTIGPLIHPVHEKKVLEYFDIARAEGATIAMGGEKIGTKGCYVGPTLFTNATSDMRIAQEEIFGPVLPVLTYESIGQVIDYVNERDRPLSLYVFSHDRRLIQRVQQGTGPGSLGVNETLLQYIQEDLAFGGVGSSGQGAYHGPAGFDTFSHLKSVFVQQGLGHLTGIKLLHPPYGPVARFLIRMMKN